MKTRGREYEHHGQGEVNYLNPEPGDRQPYPSNPQFISESVLSDGARELIYQRVFIDQEPIKVVSAHLGVDHRRVAAVVRMKQVEKQWELEVCNVYFSLYYYPPSFSFYDDSKQKFD